MIQILGLETETFESHKGTKKTWPENDLRKALANIGTVSSDMVVTSAGNDITFKFDEKGKPLPNEYVVNPQNNLTKDLHSLIVGAYSETVSADTNNSLKTITRRANRIKQGKAGLVKWLTGNMGASAAIKRIEAGTHKMIDPDSGEWADGPPEEEAPEVPQSPVEVAPEDIEKVAGLAPDDGTVEDSMMVDGQPIATESLEFDSKNVLLERWNKLAGIS